MEKFIRSEGLVAPMDRANVDTDAIIPKQYLKSIKRTGYGPNLFDAWRYLDHGEPGMDHSKRRLNPDFVLNHPRYRGATVLLARENFGCGSSREHAVWALMDFGFRAVVAPSYSDIFHNNCLKNGMLPVTLPAAEVRALLDALLAAPGGKVEIDLAGQSLKGPKGDVHPFRIDPFAKTCLLEGLDEIALTLSSAAEIDRYERERKKATPWLFRDLPG